MDSPLLVIVVLLVGLVFGASGGWFAGSRPVAEWRARHAARDAEARELDEKFRRAIVELEGASVRAAHAEGLAGELTGVRGEKEALAAELGALNEKPAGVAQPSRPDRPTGKFTLDKKGSPNKSVIVLELKDGKPTYRTTIQPSTK